MQIYRVREGKIFLPFLLEMQTVIKQAICVNVLQMCCNYGNKQR